MATSPIEEMINEIEEYVETCKPSGFSGSMIKVNRDDMQSLLEELRAKTPPEIARYQKIITNEKHILDNARRQADSILAEAQISKDKLVSEHEIMQQAYNQANEVVMEATKRAQELLDRATNEANEIRTGAIVYTDDLLKHIQEIMVRSMDITRQRQEAYLGEMQQYLDMVVANRMELSPSPEETVLDSPTPAKSTTANAEEEKDDASAKAKDAKASSNEAVDSGKKNADKDEEDGIQLTSLEKDNKEDGAGGSIRSMSEKFFKQD